jgi:hypothetical protein
MNDMDRARANWDICEISEKCQTLLAVVERVKNKKDRQWLLDCVLPLQSKVAALQEQMID